MCVFKILKKGGSKYHKRQKAPNSSENQHNAQKTKIRRLTGYALKVSKTPEVVMDDESHFTFSGSEIPAKVGYCANCYS